MGHIGEGQLSNAIIDFAHTLGGMRKVFEYVKDITKDGHSVITVFDPTGKRDTRKRRVFGKIASRYCDSIILAEDDL